MPGTITLDAVKFRFLELLYEYDQEHPGGRFVGNAYLMDEAGLSLDAAMGVVETLDSLGLVAQSNTMGNAAAKIQDSGRTAVQQVRARRVDPAARMRAARNAVVACTYEASHNGKAHRDPDDVLTCEQHGDFLGTRLTKVEIYRACDYLADKELIIGQPRLVQLTSLGEDCMTDYDGDVAEFLQSRRATQTLFNTNVSGGQGVIIGSHNFTQNNNANIDPAMLREIVTALSPELNRLGEHEPQAREALSELAEEAQAPHPHQGRVKQAFSRLVEIITGASVPVLTAYLTYKGQELGILPPAATPEGVGPLSAP